MEVIIDRFEGKYAVVELPDGTTENMPVTLIPGASEGDSIKITIDKDATEARRKRIEKLAGRLWAD